MGIALGLASALCWGVNDYFVATAARRTGTLRTVLGFHVVAVVGLGAVAVAAGALGHVTAVQLLVLLCVGVLGAASYLVYFRALEIGPISMVSPIVSGYVAVTVVLAVVLLGERLAPAQAVAVVVAMIGVVLAAVDPRQLRATRGVALLGIVFAILAMLSIGAFVFGLSYYSEPLGWLAPILIGRAFGCLVLVGLVTARRTALRPPTRSVRLTALIVLVGVLDTLGYVAFNYGVQHAETSLVAAASSPYAVVPVLMGVALFGERPAGVQWAGVAAVTGGLVLLGLSS